MTPRDGSNPAGDLRASGRRPCGNAAPCTRVGEGIRRGRRSPSGAILTLVAAAAVLSGPVHAALAVERLAVHQFEDGPLLASTHVFLPGETVFFSCRVMGFNLATGNDDQRSASLSWQIRVTDPVGVPLVRDTTGRVAQQVFDQDKNWLPKFLHNFAVPAYAMGGLYKILVTVKDEVAGEELRTQLEFQVKGHAVEPSETLVPRNLRFLAAGEDGAPLDPAVYRPGETLWARFDITGYKFGEKNRYSVEYGLAVLRESGEQVFAQPSAASDSSESFYPQRYVPGAVNLNLDPNVPKGVYRLVVMTEDKIGGQKAEARGLFRIE